MKEEREVSNVENRPCGCVVTHYDDGGQMFKPCPPHGLMRVAECMQEASQAMASVASTLMDDHRKVMHANKVATTMQQAQADTDAAEKLAESGEES